jgi:arginyl-tRNA--protein-N-Asp/Glu arginylyltransferase
MVDILDRGVRKLYEIFSPKMHLKIDIGTPNICTYMSNMVN